MRLYGESDYESFQRLRKLEILEPEKEKLRTIYLHFLSNPKTLKAPTMYVIRSGIISDLKVLK